MLKKYGKYIIGFILIVVGVAVLGIIVYNLLTKQKDAETVINEMSKIYYEEHYFVEFKSKYEEDFEKKAKELLNDGLDPIDIVTNNRTRYCDLDGFVYDSLSDMCKALGIDKKEVMRRMSFGYGIRDILLELVFDKKYI